MTLESVCRFLPGEGLVIGGGTDQDRQGKASAFRVMNKLLYEQTMETDDYQNSNDGKI